MLIDVVLASIHPSKFWLTIHHDINKDGKNRNVDKLYQVFATFKFRALLADFNNIWHKRRVNCLKIQTKNTFRLEELIRGMQ